MGDYSAYYEALIFGKLELSDVDYWLVNYSPEEIQEDLTDNGDTVLMRLLKTGKKVYQAKRVNINGRSEFEKGPIIKPPQSVR